MFDLKFIRENIDKIRYAIKVKNEKVNIDEFVEVDERLRELIVKRDEIRQKRNQLNKKIGELKRHGKDAREIIEESRKLQEALSELEKEVESLEARRKKIMDWIPNIPHESVGDEPVIVRQYEPKNKIDFEPHPAHEIIEALGLVDFKRSAKLAGSNFPCYIGEGARLERALINFMLDLHIKQGYKEVFPPFLVNRNAMFGTAQLPKLEDDMYRIEEDDLFLNPTAEVPLINLHRDEKLSEDDLPINYVGYTACFRREAGSWGKKTKGLMRVHQFNKVELIKFTKPEDSYNELEKMLADAEEVLKLLDLPYRVVLLPNYDLSFASAKTYDIEVYAPGSKMWLEVSSVSNCEAFQARRANIRFKRKTGELDFVHTLNGSGVALPRTFIAIVENYQNKDGTIRVPEVLWDYFGNKTIGE